MENLDELKIGQYVPAMVIVDEKKYEEAFPIPFLKVIITSNNNHMQILEVDKAIKSAIPSGLVKKVKADIPLSEIKTIEFEAIKHFNGGFFNEGFNNILNLRFFCAFNITLINEDVYSFLNSSMLLILDVYHALKNLNINFIDKHNLISILSGVNIDNSAYEIEKEIVNVMLPIADDLAYIHEKGK